MKKRYFDLEIEYIPFGACDVITMSTIASVDEEEKITDPYDGTNKSWY